MSAAPLDQLLPEDSRRRGAARRWVDERGWPTRKDEAWRYAPLDAIAAVAAAGTPGDGGAATTEQLVDEITSLAAAHPAWSPGTARVVLVDGRPAVDWSSPPDALAAAGLVVMRAVLPEPFLPTSRSSSFDALNVLATPGVTVVEVTEADAARAVHLVHLTTGQPVASNPRTRLHVGDDVALTVVETFRSLAGSVLTNAATSIDVAAGGRVDHVRDVRVGHDGAHVGSTAIVLHERARVRSGTLQLGAGALRHAVTVELTGPDATAELRGLSLPGAGGHHDTEVSVQHRASAGTSRQHYAGIVADGARVSFGGHVLVDAGTTGTDADQRSRNLLLGPTARADARPWLEICSDDVRCTHGATVGRLDDDGLFYLRSRGVPEHEAREMLLQAFVASLLEELAPPGAIADWLAAVAADGIRAAR